MYIYTDRLFNLTFIVYQYLKKIKLFICPVSSMKRDT